MTKSSNGIPSPPVQRHPALGRPRRRFPSAVFAALVAVVPVWCFAFRACAGSFQGLGDLPGSNYFSVATAVSSDARVVVGYSRSTNGLEAMRWTASEGMVGLGDLPGGTFNSFANAVSADGTVVVGFGRSAAGDEAFRWTQTGGMVGLGDLPGGNFGSTAWGVSADGQVIVGFSSSALSATRSEAFRWTATNGMTGLGDLPGSNYSSRAWAVSADGSVVVGESSSSNGNEAFRWTADTGMAPLGDLPGGIFNSIAYSVSADGSVVVGYGSPDNSGTHEAFRWTAAAGLVPLGSIPCDTWSIARAASGDGSLIVGDPQTARGDCVFIWQPRHGMRRLYDVLTSAYELDLTGWELRRATAVSADGNTIVGYGVNPAGNTEAWIATGLNPALTIRHSNDTCWLSWPVSASDFTLQSSDNLVSGWSNVVASASTNGTSMSVTQGLSGSMRFYRLAR